MNEEDKITVSFTDEGYAAIRWGWSESNDVKYPALMVSDGQGNQLVTFRFNLDEFVEFSNFQLILMEQLEDRKDYQDAVLRILNKRLEAQGVEETSE